MTFGENGVDDGEFENPSGITVNPTDGTIYVSRHIQSPHPSL